VAVRKANGELTTETAPLAKVSERYPIFKLPVARGLGALGQAMWLGIKAMGFSANAALEGDLATEGKPAQISSTMMAITLGLNLLFVIFLYKFVPLFVATQVGDHVPALHGRIAINLVDGLVRIAILLGFLTLLSMMKDIRRVFAFHGAEHKVVFNFESGKPVDVRAAQEFQTFHPRCGTSFLIVVVLISLLSYAFLPFDGFVGRFLARLALLPLVVGLSYELIRLAAKQPGSFFAALTAPGLWSQRITTKQPSDDQVAVAIHALNGAMELEKAQGGELVIA